MVGYLEETSGKRTNSNAQVNQNGQVLVELGGAGGANTPSFVKESYIV